VLDKLVQPVKVDIGENGAHHAALRRAAERAVELPLFQISGLEEMLDQPKKTLVKDLLPQNRQ
jgi:hypothetical protein